jgi:hypothetical protein
MPQGVLTPDEWPYGHYFLNLIHWRWCCWQADANGYVHLCDSLLRKYVPKKRLPTIKKKLSRAGVIECDCAARWGDAKGKAYGYRLKGRFRKTYRVPCDNDRLAAKIMRSQREQRDRLTPTCRWLRDNLDRLHFDAGEAARIIDGMTPDKGGKIQDVAEYRRLIAASAARLAGGELWLTRCDYGRVHTPLTSLPRVLRRCLTVGGERLVGIDLKNSQPLFLGLLCRASGDYRGIRRGTPPDTPSESRQERSFFSSGKQPKQHNKHHKTNPNQTPPHNDAPFPDMPSDLREYLEVCQRGECYESLAAPDRTRDEVKAKLWLPLFGHPSEDRAYQGWVWHRLCDRYPTVAGFLYRIKMREYERLAHLLQGHESNFFISTVCPRIRRERPDLPLYTIHDSLLTTPVHVGYVRGVVMDEFRKMGLEPSLKVEV